MQARAIEQRRIVVRESGEIGLFPVLVVRVGGVVGGVEFGEGGSGLGEGEGERG